MSLIALSEGAPLELGTPAGRVNRRWLAEGASADEILLGGGSRQFAQRVLHQLPEMRDQRRHVARQPVEAGLFIEAALVHVKRPVDLDLQRVPGPAGAAVMPGGKPAGIRRIDRNREVALRQKGARCLDD